LQCKRFGKTDMKFSVIGLGAWQAGMKSWGKNYTIEDVMKAIETAFEEGINFVDTAEIYGGGRSEEVLGRVLRAWGDSIFVATKVSGYNARPGRIEKSLKASLRRLNRRCVDLYQVHWPPSIYTSLPKVARELEMLVDKGLVRYIGVSNFPRDILEEFMGYMRKYEVVSNQVRYSLLHRAVENDLYPFMKESNIELIAWSPLDKGVLAGKFKADAPAKYMDSGFRRVRKARGLINKLREIADKHGVSMAQVSLAWLVAKGAYPIPGAKRPSQARDNASAGDLRLDPDEVSVLDDLSLDFRYGDVGTIMPRVIPNILQQVFIGILGGI